MAREVCHEDEMSDALCHWAFHQDEVNRKGYKWTLVHRAENAHVSGECDQYEGM
jgi:hypothetical protein